VYECLSPIVTRTSSLHEPPFRLLCLKLPCAEVPAGPGRPSRRLRTIEPGDKDGSDDGRLLQQGRLPAAPEPRPSMAPGRCATTRRGRPWSSAHSLQPCQSTSTPSSRPTKSAISICRRLRGISGRCGRLCWESSITIGGSGSRPVLIRAARRRRSMAAAQTPSARRYAPAPSARPTLRRRVKCHTLWLRSEGDCWGASSVEPAPPP